MNSPGSLVKFIVFMVNLVKHTGQQTIFSCGHILGFQQNSYFQEIEQKD